jgi:hypothetical protein
VHASTWLPTVISGLAGLAGAAIGGSAILVARRREQRTRAETERLVRLERVAAASLAWHLFVVGYTPAEGAGLADRIARRRDLIRHDGRMLERLWQLSDRLLQAIVDVMAVASDEEREVVAALQLQLERTELGERTDPDVEQAWQATDAQLAQLLVQARSRNAKSDRPHRRTP